MWTDAVTRRAAAKRRTRRLRRVDRLVAWTCRAERDPSAAPGGPWEGARKCRARAGWVLRASAGSIGRRGLLACPEGAARRIRRTPNRGVAGDRPRFLENLCERAASEHRFPVAHVDTNGTSRCARGSGPSALKSSLKSFPAGSSTADAMPRRVQRNCRRRAARAPALSRS